MNKTNLIKWGKQQYSCVCGLEIKNSRKKDHIGNELCKELTHHKIVSIKGTDKINCRICDKLITVCGLHVHMKTHN